MMIKNEVYFLVCINKLLQPKELIFFRQLCTFEEHRHIRIECPVHLYPDVNAPVLVLVNDDLLHKHSQFYVRDFPSESIFSISSEVLFNCSFFCLQVLSYSFNSFMRSSSWDSRTVCGVQYFLPYLWQLYAGHVHVHSITVRLKARDHIFVRLLQTVDTHIFH